MNYFDTSFLAPLFLQEAKSGHVEKILQSISQKRYISCWLEVEFSSLIARNVRMKLFNKSHAELMISSFRALVKDSFTILAPSLADFDLACDYLQHIDSGLRSGDALHLAIAKNNGAKKIYTLDKVLEKAVKTLTSITVIS